MTAASGGDVIVIGGGVIGLATAQALATHGVSVTVLEGTPAGAASPASAGLLAPGAERAEMAGAAHAFAVASRERYPAWLEALAGRTGVHVPFDRSGILELALDSELGGLYRQRPPAGAEWIDSTTLSKLEPALAPGIPGALLYPKDGSVDPVALLGALRGDLAGLGVELLPDDAMSIAAQPNGPAVTTRQGRTVHGTSIVLAAGAWSPRIMGLPRALPIEPVRGQMLAYPKVPIRRVIYAPKAYAVRRGEFELMAGSTMERVGFDSGTTNAGRSSIEAGIGAIVPSLRGSTVTRQWSGLRPVTPDLLPIIGRDPAAPWLIYATGHSRNGILMAPLTAESVAALIVNGAAPADISPFAPDRFNRETSV